jgi:hypothetical protein
VLELHDEELNVTLRGGESAQVGWEGTMSIFAECPREAQAGGHHMVGAVMLRFHKLHSHVEWNGLVKYNCAVSANGVWPRNSFSQTICCETGGDHDRSTLPIPVAPVNLGCQELSQSHTY